MPAPSISLRKLQEKSEVKNLVRRRDASQYDGACPLELQDDGAMHDLLYMAAVAGLGLSGVASAIRLIEWLIRTDPRVIAQTGRWAAFGLAALSGPLLLALLINEKWVAAMTLAAIMLVWFAWHGPRLLQRMVHNRVAPDLSSQLAGNLTPGFDESIGEPALVRRSIAVLEEYLRRSEGLSQNVIYPRAIGVKHSDEAGSVSRNGSVQGRTYGPMSKAEAFDVLGLGADASEGDIRQAHERLRELLRPEHAGSPYLVGKVDDALWVLLGYEDECRASAQSWRSQAVPHSIQSDSEAAAGGSR